MAPEGYLNSKVLIRADILSNSDMSYHKHRLTYIARQFKGAGNKKPTSICLLEDMGGFIAVPRKYAFENMGKILRNLTLVDELTDGNPVSIKFNYELQDSMPDKKKLQDRLITEFYEGLKAQQTPFKGGVLSAGCGTGKTVMGIRMLCEIGRQTLILVHKEFLLNQWVEQICKFTSLNKADIGVIQQDRCELDKPVSIGLMQTMHVRGYDPSLLSCFGLVIVDEVHRASAPTFANAIRFVDARLRIGLTATVKRSDGLEGVFLGNLGDILAQYTRYDLKPVIYQMHWFSKQRVSPRTPLARIINMVAEDIKRTCFIVDEICKALRAGRKCFVLSHRREHLNTMQTLIEQKTGGLYSVGQYVGGVKQQMLDKVAKMNCILATYQLAKEGVDIPSLDALFLTTPAGSIEQAVGRVLRHHPDKKPPIVIDLIDYLDPCPRLGYSRLRFYKSKNFEVKKVN